MTSAKPRSQPKNHQGIPSEAWTDRAFLRFLGRVSKEVSKTAGDVLRELSSAMRGLTIAVTVICLGLIFSGCEVPGLLVLPGWRDLVRSKPAEHGLPRSETRDTPPPPTLPAKPEVARPQAGPPHTAQATPAPAPKPPRTRPAPVGNPVGVQAPKPPVTDTTAVARRIPTDQPPAGATTGGAKWWKIEEPDEATKRTQGGM